MFGYIIRFYVRILGEGDRRLHPSRGRRTGVPIFRLEIVLAGLSQRYGIGAARKAQVFGLHRVVFPEAHRCIFLAPFLWT